MILKASQRSGGSQLAAHLLRGDENEHVEVHELRGFMGDDLHSAFQEVQAASKGTRAKQYLFSLSLNPPSEEKVSIETFETAIDKVEKKLGLEDQPRAIVFHEKEGRRHAHAVWSRIDTEEMKAIRLSHYKLKLNDVAKEIYLEHGWKMPQGFTNREERNPLNFTREEWQQARRAGHDPKKLKHTFQECWEISDSRKAYEQALWNYGLVLARGDRRGYVAVDYQGEVYAIARYTGIRTKQVRERLGGSQELPSIEQAKAKIATQISRNLFEHLESAKKEQKQRKEKLALERKELVERQKKERQKLKEMHEARWNAESVMRSQRLAKGLKGVWHRMTGQYSRTKRENERETLLAYQRDRKQKDTLIFRHIQERKNLHQQADEQIKPQAQEIQKLRQEISRYSAMRTNKPLDLKTELEKAKKEHRQNIKNNQTQSPDNDPEPEI